MWKKGFLALIVLILTVSIVHAADFDVSMVPVKDSISSGEQAEFLLTVTNNQEEEHHFGIILKSDYWMAQSLIGGMRVGPHTSKTDTLLLTPTQLMAPGAYKIHVIIRDSTIDESVHLYPVVALKSYIPTLKQYLELDPVIPLVDLPEKVDPRQEFTLTINMKNKNPVNSTKFTILLNSYLITEQVPVTLEGDEKRTLTHNIKLNPDTVPQKDTLRITFVANDVKLSPTIMKPFEVTGYSLIKEQKETSGFLLKRTTQFTYLNDANEPNTKSLEIQTNFFKNIFTETEPKAFRIAKDGKTYLAWSLSFKAKETKTLKYTLDYIPLAIIIISIILILFVYTKLRSPIVLKKEAFTVGTTDDGISEIKVLIHLKNRTDKRFEKAVLVDRIPDIVVVSKEAKPGTVEPNKVYRHEKEGTVAKWDLGAIDKREERIISYRIKSKLAIIGGVRLPPALLRFYDDKITILTTKSNPYHLNY